MDPAAAGRSIAGTVPAGAVAIHVDAAAAGAGAGAAPPAGGAAAAGAGSAARVARVTVAWAGAAGAGAGGPRRVAWAAALFVLGSAAAGLALFAMTVVSDDDDNMVGGCKPTPADVAAAQSLLLAAAAQMLAATLAVLMPARLVAVYAHVVGWLAADPAMDVLWTLVACHDSAAHDALSSSFRFARFLLWLQLAAGTVASLC